MAAFRLPVLLFLVPVFMILCPQAARADCATPDGVAGDIVYAVDNKILQYCDGTDWQRMNQRPGSGSGGCATVTAGTKPEGHILYNADHRVLQVCAGNVWRAVGPIPDGSSGIGDWAQISLGNMHGCGIKFDGTLWCWGSEANGRLGNGSTTGEQQAPVQIGTDTWISISASVVSGHTCGVKSGGTLWCWGQDLMGELGNGATTGDQSTPVQEASSSTWKMVAAGMYFSCGIKADDTVWCWGLDGFGTLGNGAGGNTDVPGQESSGSTWKDVSAGAYHACAVKKSDDTLWCWGNASGGRLGNGANFGFYQSPSQELGAATWKTVSARTLNAVSCGIRTDDTLWCWGGFLPDGSGSWSPVPVQESGGATWKKVSVTGNGSCGIKSDDTIWCWGDNDAGQLGDGGTTNQLSPVPIAGGGSWIDVSGSSATTCGITTAGVIECWGLESLISPDGHSSIYVLIPTEVAGSANWDAVSAKYYGCGIKTDDTAWCWGPDNRGQLGNGATTGSQSEPSAVSGGASWKTIVTGGGFITDPAHSCGIRSDDTLWCWGSDSNGQLGNGATTGDQASPVQVAGGGTWKKVSTGYRFTCGIKSDDSLWCWGPENNGELGNGATTGDQASPVQELSGSTWKAVAAGGFHACGIRADDTLWCWGGDGSGQLGNGATTGDQNSPVQESSGSTWKSVTASTTNGINQGHTCGIRSDDTLWCWGLDTAGELGNGATTGDQVSPVQVAGGGAWIAVDAVQSRTCGIKTDYSLWCWGSAFIGDGTLSSRDSPTAVYGGGQWMSVSAGYSKSCGIKIADGQQLAHCWGNKRDGGLGNGELGYYTSAQETWCGQPPARPGVIKFNAGHEVMQYCNGTSWVHLGK